MAKKPRKETFRQLCESKGANLSEMARILKCSRRAVNDWIQKDPAFREIYDDVRESLLDLCESQMVNLIKGIPKIVTNENGQKTIVGYIEKPDVAAIIFTLKTKGKDRGYVERSELTGKDGQPLMPASPVVVMSPEEYARLEAEEKNG